MSTTLPLAIFQNIGAPELIIVFVIILLLFGAKRLPELFRSFGKSINEFKKATKEIEDDMNTAMNSEPKKSEGPATEAPAPEPRKAEAEAPQK